MSIAGPNNLNMPDKANLPITGAGGVTGNDMEENTWGYSFGETEAESDDMPDGARVYHSMSSTGTNLTNLPSLVDGDVSFSRKLVFAAKFSPRAVAGNYTAAVTLSLAVTPEEVGSYWKNEEGGVTAYEARTSTMQGIDSGFCKDNNDIAEGWTLDLKDTRDNSIYTIVKLRDGNCWMQENLHLNGDTNLMNKENNNLTAADTDNPLDGSWWLPETQEYSADSWTKDLSALMSRHGDEGEDVANGNYYTWCAVTAGTCVDAMTSGIEAAGSICPRGWRIPTGGEGGQYQVLFSSDVLGEDHEKIFEILQAAPYLYVPSGYVAGVSGTTGSVGNTGYYWSGTSHTEEYAASMYFNNTGFSSTSYDYRYNGLPVRCIASY